jgi:hypothetical protein
MTAHDLDSCRIGIHTVLYWTVLYCTVLYCTVLYCTVLYCTVLYCTVLYCTGLEIYLPSDSAVEAHARGCVLLRYGMRHTATRARRITPTMSTCYTRRSERWISALWAHMPYKYVYIQLQLRSGYPNCMTD